MSAYSDQDRTAQVAGRDRDVAFGAKQRFRRDYRYGGDTAGGCTVEPRLLLSALRTESSMQSGRMRNAFRVGV
jgi:hypothetical protein